jgi:serralysin
MVLTKYQRTSWSWRLDLIRQPIIAACVLLATPAMAAPDLRTITAAPPIWADEFTNGPTAGEWDRGLSPWPNTIANRIMPGTGERQVFVDPAYLGSESVFAVNGTALILAQRMDAGTRGRVDAKITLEKPFLAAEAALRKADWISGALKGRKGFQYGYVEASFRVSDPAPSAWPAFWLLPVQWGWPPEIDILEIPGDQVAHQTLHSSPGDPFPRPTCKTPLLTPGRFHSYGVHWTAETITFFVDRVQTCSFPTPYDMKQPMYPILSLAVGGWATAPDATTTNMQMQIDYIRWWAL